MEKTLNTPARAVSRRSLVAFGLTALFAGALAGCGALSFVTGLILDTVAKSHRRQWEIDVYKALNGFYRE